MLSEIDFEAVLATFYFYDYGANTSKAVQKIPADRKDYYKFSSCVIVSWIAEIHQLITVEKGELLGHLQHTLESRIIAPPPPPDC